MRKIRWGVLGAGGIADRRTLPAMMLCDQTELIAVMEVEKDKAESLREKYKAKRAYISDEQLLKDPEIDAVYIASPVHLHAKQAMMAADFSKHILIEKPLAITAKDGQKVLEYCNMKGVRIAAGFMMRFGACVQAMKEAINLGRIGDIVSATAQFSCWYPEIQGSWRQVKAFAGGGALTDMGIHVIDLMRFITGLEVGQVAGMHGTSTFSYDVEDSACTLLRLNNGALCSLQTHFNIPDMAANWGLEFYGTKGHLIGKNVIGQEDAGTVEAIFLDNIGGYNAQQSLSSAKTINLKVEYGNLYAREIASFGNSILNGTSFDAPAEAAIKAQKIIEAAYLSNDQKIIVSL